VSIEKLKVENNQELEQMIINEINKVEKDLTVIYSNVPITDQATLDILCHDSDGQLGIVRLSVNEDDIMLLHGIQSLDYIDKFKSFLKATYNKHSKYMDASASVRARRIQSSRFNGEIDENIKSEIVRFF